jgi:hypothetical protein
MKTRKLICVAVLTLFVAVPVVASSTWYVDGVNGSDGNDCKSAQHACRTIGHAISLAHSGDSIMVAPATYTENLSIRRNLKIVGSSAQTTIIDGAGNGTVVTIFSASVRATLSKVTVRNGLAQYGGGISTAGALTVIESTISTNRAFTQCTGDCSTQGGGIYNSGVLTITRSTISGNSANSQCNAVCSPYGGGILNGGTLTISQSTISGNSAVITAPIGVCHLVCRVFGGGIYNGGTLAISNSTLSGNQTKVEQNFGGQGGGIYNGGTLAISNSTLSANNTGDGGGILNLDRTTLQNSIVANNLGGGNCSGTMTSNGYNLGSDGTCNFNNTGDLNNTDPKLGQLGNYGGPTQTIPLRSGSPAIDAGNPNGCTDGDGHLLKTDQRGKPRPDHEDTGGCDMGAYEREKD